MCKDAVFEVNAENRAAFESLKDYVVMSCQELEILRFDGSFLLQTDASYRFIAAALYNVHADGTVKLCACYSACLNDRQTRQCILKKSC